MIKIDRHMLLKNMSMSALLLSLFAVIGTLILAITYETSLPHIKKNQRQALLQSLHVLIPSDQYDNDIYKDVIQVKNPELLGSKRPVNIYLARKNGQPVAAIINAIAPDGYSGKISLLVAIRYNGDLAGVRVIEHMETPGLGDAIEERRSNWILQFQGKSLNNPSEPGWAVKRDGGKIDQFTGATITPRAVVKAVHRALKYFAEQRKTLFNVTQKHNDKIP